MSFHPAALSSLGLVYRWKVQILAEDSTKLFYVFVSPNDTLTAVLKAASEMYHKLYQLDADFKYARNGSGADLDLDFRVMQILSYDEQLHVATAVSAFQSTFPTAEYLRRLSTPQAALGGNSLSGFPLNAPAVLIAPHDMMPGEPEEDGKKKKRKTRVSRKANPKEEAANDAPSQAIPVTPSKAEASGTNVAAGKANEAGSTKVMSDFINSARPGGKNPKAEETTTGPKSLPTLGKPTGSAAGKANTYDSDDHDLPTTQAGFGTQDSASTKKKAKKTA